MWYTHYNMTLQAWCSPSFMEWLTLTRPDIHKWHYNWWSRIYTTQQGNSAHHSNGHTHLSPSPPPPQQSPLKAQHWKWDLNGWEIWRCALTSWWRKFEKQTQCPYWRRSIIHRHRHTVINSYTLEHAPICVLEPGARLRW